MRKDEFLALHNLYIEVLKWINEEPSDEYNDFNVGPESLPSKKSDQKHAVYLLTRDIAENLKEDGYDSNVLEGLAQEINEEEFGSFSYREMNQCYLIEYDGDLRDENVKIRIGKDVDQSERWQVLEDLSEAKDLYSVLERRYEKRTGAFREWTSLLGVELPRYDPVLPKKHQKDLSKLINYHFGQDQVQTAD